MFPALLLAVSTLTLDHGDVHLEVPSSVRLHRSRVNWETDEYDFYEANYKESFLQVVVGGGAYDLHSFLSVCQNGRQAWKLQHNNAGMLVMGEPGSNALAVYWAKLSGERLAEAKAIVSSLRIDWGPKCDAAEPSDQPGSYNYYQKRGNIAAMNGDFDAAISYWQRAERLAPADPSKKCHGEGQRVQIRAAKDAKARMRSQGLTKTQAATWYEQREFALWIPDKCNGP